VVVLETDVPRDPDIEWTPWLSPGQVDTVAVVESTVTAAGSFTGSAAIWTWDPVVGWQTVPDIDPGIASSRVQVLVSIGSGEALALGAVGNDVAVWESASSTEWEYLGEEEALPGVQVTDAAWGPAGLVVLGYQVSDDGMATEQGIWLQGHDGAWSSVPIPLDPRAAFVLRSVTSTEDGYVIGGSFVSEVEPDGRHYRPVVLTSGDGVTWDVVGAGSSALLPFDMEGAIIDVAGSPEGPIAVGLAGGGNRFRPAVWRSSDGEAWYRVGVDDAAFDLAPIEVEVRATTIGGDGTTATLAIGHDEVQVGVDTRIHGLGLDAVVTAILSDRVVLDVSGETERISVGATASFERNSYLSAVAVSGDRLVAVGSVSGDPAAWSSADGGASWQVSALPVEQPDPASSVRGTAFAVAMVGSDVVAVSSDVDGGSRITHGVWRRSSGVTDVSTAATIDRLPRFLAAVASGDGDAAAGLLGADLPETGEFSLPTLGGIALDWRDDTTGGVDRAAVADSAAYLAALDTDVVVEGCAVQLGPGDVEVVPVTCTYRASSALLSLLGVEQEQGTVTARVGADGIMSVATREAESTDAWLSLAEWAADFDRSEFLDVVGSIGANGRWQLAPTITQTAAQRHLALAARFAAVTIEPGTSVAAETGAGTVEFSWPEIPDVSGPLMWAGDRYVTAGQDAAGTLSLFESTDGLEWSSGSLPAGASWIEGVVEIGGSRVALGRRGAGPAVWVQSGGAWSLADGIPDLTWNDPSVEPVVGQIVAYRGDAYVLAFGWEGADGSTTVQIWRIGADGSCTVFDISAAVPDAYFTDRGLLASEDGLFLITGATASTTSIWRSSDGEHWDEVTADLGSGGDNGVILLDIEATASGFVAIADPIGVGWESVGGGRHGEVWVSPDGRFWTRATGTGGETVTSSRIGVGPAGVLAIRDSTTGLGGSSLWFSADGTSWEWIGRVADLDTGGGKALVSPVVGDDSAVLVVGTAGDGTRPPSARVLVARFLDR